jgi:uroporphyrinogen-III synthase
MSFDQEALDAAMRPLLGWRIITTRASKQSGGLAQPLRDLGAEVTEIPTIEIRPPKSYKALDGALRKIAKYEWLIVTSANGAEAVFERLKKLKMPVDELKHLKIAAIGPATKKTIEAQGLGVAVTPEKAVAESVVEALRGKTEGKRVLLARAKIARDVLPIELKKAGAKVDVVEAYETVIPAGAKAKVQRAFSGRVERPDIVTFTSASTVTNFLGMLGQDAQKRLADVAMASIGPVTSKALADAGFAPKIEARESTMQGLVLAISEYVHKAAAQELLKRLFPGG